MIQIQFIDYDILNAVLPVISIKPDKVICFYDDLDISSNVVNCYIETIKNRLPNVEYELVEIDRYDMLDVFRKMSNIVNKQTDELVFDITGDFEIVAACMMRMATIYNSKIVFTNIRSGYIYDFRNGRILYEIEKIGIDDYLCANGAKRIDHSRFVPAKKDFKKIERVFKWTIENQHKWSVLAEYLSKHYNDKRLHLPEKISGYLTSDLLKVFIDNKYILVGKDYYEFNGSTARQYCTTYGIWLELYTYIKAKEYFDEVEIGFIIDWDGNDDFDTIDNEIDVVAVKDTKPYFISCKNRKPVTKDLYEVSYLTNRFGGENGCPILCSTFDYGNDKNSNTSIYNKYDKFLVGRIEAKDFLVKSSKEVFEAAIKQTKK